MRTKFDKRFKQDYDRIFRKNPESANLFLLLSELAGKKGKVLTDEAELARLMAKRFQNPRTYQL